MGEHKNSVYRSISEDIAGKIKSGEYAKGEMLAPERKLMEQYKTQRTTIRRALDILVNEGLIIKKTGLGTFISDGTDIAETVPKPQPVHKNTVKAPRKSLPKWVSFKNDVYSASELVLEKLKEMGHSTVIYIGRNPETFTVMCGCLVKNGMFDSDSVAVAEGRFDADIMFEKIWRGLRSPKPTAVIADNSADGEKIIKTAGQYRLSVPDELSIISIETSVSSDISGCIFNTFETKKKLLAAFAEAESKDIPEMEILAGAEYFDGETVSELKKDTLGSGRMSDYLL